MALTSAVAHAAAANAGAGKKAAQVHLQAELNTDEEWKQFIQKDGLLVVDVYTEWCGPCIGMVGNLKKIKVELGGDNLHLAVAKADTIECLKRFRNKSEPTWMFLAAGQLLNVVFGANAPRIARTIEEELQNEEQARKGQRERPQRAPHELTPHEQETALELERQKQRRRDREAEAASEARHARREARAVRLEVQFTDVCPALLLPHAQKHLRKVADALEPYGVIIADKCPMVVGKEIGRLLAMEAPELGTEEAVAALMERPSLALMLKKLPDKEGNVIELSRRALFGEVPESVEEESSKTHLYEELTANNVPGLFVPADRHQRAAALDALFPKTVSAVAEPPESPEAPHLALMFGAWQRRAVLAAAPTRILRYGFFADPNVMEPKLLCKTTEEYEGRMEKDYSETIVIMLAVGVAEPALVDPENIPSEEPPEDLMSLGPLHVSEDTVIGAEECNRFFPAGYNEPESKPKPKSRKKKKKRHETKEDTTEENTDNANSTVEETDAGDLTPDGDGEGNPEGEGDEDLDKEDAEDDAEEETHADKATSPPPTT